MTSTFPLVEVLSGADLALFASFSFISSLTSSDMQLIVLVLTLPRKKLELVFSFVSLKFTMEEPCREYKEEPVI